ncbi:MAG: peptide chain release factor 1 [Candidatus Omnitrophica bacterium]|nr:peptide chain release factor 1 [Candidatus Omnitrophota bacterium]
MAKNLLLNKSVDKSGNALIIKKFRKTEKEYNEILDFISRSENYNGPSYREKIKKIGEMEESVSSGRKYVELLQKREDIETLLNDESLIELAEEEKNSIDREINQTEEKLRDFFFSTAEDKKNCIMEIRAGTGGTEASLFAKDLFRMYARYADKKGWKIDILNSHSSEIGGFKEIVFVIEGKDAYGELKYESGVHRVQRIPVTEANGRIHTSAATVAVFPEIEEKERDIDPKDLKIDTFCASGKGGQSVNTTYSAVRITHVPTGVVVACQDERSQAQNKLRAMKILRAKINSLVQQKKEEELSINRKEQIKTGDRSEKIRTYNFPQNRITDHRINLTLYNLSEIIDGNIEPMIKEIKKESLKGT